MKAVLTSIYMVWVAVAFSAPAQAQDCLSPASADSILKSGIPVAAAFDDRGAALGAEIVEGGESSFRAVLYLGNSLTTPVCFTVETTVDYAVLHDDGTAKWKMDFDFPGRNHEGTLTFLAYEDASDSVEYTIIDDVADEGDEAEFFLVGLSNFQPAYNIGLPPPHRVDVKDNDFARMSIHDAKSVNEGAELQFEVHLSTPSTQHHCFFYRTIDGTAKANLDYTPADTEEIFELSVFAPYIEAIHPTVTEEMTVLIVRVETLADTIYEQGGEHLSVELVGVSPLDSLDKWEAQGFIREIESTPPNPHVTISTSKERESENVGSMVFDVTVAPDPNIALDSNVSVRFFTEDGTAKAGEDYYETTGTLTFQFGEFDVRSDGATAANQTKQVRVRIINDGIDEYNETFDLKLEEIADSGYTSIVDSNGVGTIIDNDVPEVHVEDPSLVYEGEDIPFVVFLTIESKSDVVVEYETSEHKLGEPMTASEGVDYEDTAGSLTFMRGETRKTAHVKTLDDAFYEPEEYEHFHFTIRDPLGEARLIGGAPTHSAEGKILDNDLAPGLSISNDSTNESDGELVFGVTLDQPSGSTVTVDYATINDTAEAPGDYLTVSGMITFDTGDTLRHITVKVIDDEIVEATERMFVVLSNPVDVTLGKLLGMGTILDNDVPNLSLMDVADSEDAGELVFLVLVDPYPARTVELTYMTSDGTAVAGNDYVETSSTLTIVGIDPNREYVPVSVEMPTIRVPLIDDELVEEPAEETFTVILSADPTYATVTSPATGTIVDDDVYPTVSGHDTRGLEDIGELNFIVELNGSYPETITVDYATTDNTATSPADYRGVAGTLTFAPEETTKTVVVAIVDDEWVEPDEEEMFELVLSNPVNAVFGNSATGTIIDDDVYPTVSAHDARGAEDIGELGFVVELNVSYAENATVDYATSDNTATSPADYRGASGTLTFAPGETTATVDVAIVDDADVEFGETFHLVLSNPGNTVLGENATGTILDDDEPSASIGDASGPEDAGELTFTATLDKPSMDEVVLAYAAKDGTATAGRDYGAVTGTLTFAPGNTSMDVPVAIIDDHDDEPDETFTVELSAPQNTVIGDPIGTGTITDDDEPPVASRALPAELMLCVGGEHRKIDLSEYFSGEDMRFDADMSDGTIAVASIAGTILTVEPVDKGSATLTVTATNLVGSAGTGTRVVVVTDPGELNAVESTFAAIGQNTLGEVVEAVADRSEFVSWSVYESPGRSISVWNRNGARQFERGDVREGRLRSHQIGVDMQFGGWRVGVAGMTSAGNARYGYGKTLELCGAAEGAPGEGLVETDLDSIHPYAIRRLGTGSVWGTVGYGRGDSHLGERCGKAPEMDGGLSMTTIAAGGRHPFRVGERTTFSVVESVGMLRYDSQMSFWDGGGNRIEIGRARVGVEAVGTNRPECACILATYGRIWAQTEWGDGHTGTGMELDAGVRYLDRERRLGFDIGLRGVPFHSIRDHRELGVDAAFMFLPAHDGTGLRTKTIYRDGRTFTEVGYGFKRGGDAVVAFLSTGDSMTLAGVKHKWFELSVGRTAAGDNVVRFSLRWRGGSAADASAWDALHNTVRRQNGAAHTGQGTHGNMALRGM